MKFFILLFLFANLFAQDDYSIRVAHGQPTTSDFGQVLILDVESHPKDLRVTSLDIGYLLQENTFNLPIDIYAKSGLSYFYEDNTHDDVLEGTVYLKVYYNIDFWENRVRFGLGEGVSYTSAVLYAESREAEKKKDNTSRFLNYVDLSLDVDLGKLVRYKKLEGTSLGWALKHRSGIFGTINNVKNGGSNYNTVYIETKF
jgi:outer membrane protein